MYNASLHTVMAKPLAPSTGMPLDARNYFYDIDLFVYRPYRSTGEVLQYLNTVPKRIGHFSVFVSSGTLNNDGSFSGGVITEYWFKDGVSDNNLVIKGGGAGGGVDFSSIIGDPLNNILLSALLSKKVNVVEGKGLSSEDFTSILKTKLSGIQTGATQNSSDAYLLDRQYHQGAQDISTIIGLVEALQSKITEADLNTAINALKGNVPPEADTLAEVYTIAKTNSNKSVNTISERNAYNATLGQFIYVANDGNGKSAIYRASTSGVNATYEKIFGSDLQGGNLTASEVKSLYESNPDTNRFTDALYNKLNAIQAAATANATNAQLRDRATHTGIQPASSIVDFADAVLQVMGGGLDNYYNKEQVNGFLANALGFEVSATYAAVTTATNKRFVHITADETDDNYENLYYHTGTVLIRLTHRNIVVK